tara:strand:+ start:2505 stop:4742 length:2238 start_codon:yes stop_codon:yes gene_type:complete
MFKYIFSILFFIIFSFKVNSQIVNEIVVENNVRVSTETIINFSKINIGDNIDDNKLNSIIKDLYETNFFSDINVKIINNKLTIFVEENKIIQSIIINGIKAKKFKDAILDEIKLQNKSPYNEYLASIDLILIKEVLVSQGFYFSKVKSSISNNTNNTIDLIYDVEMGDKALVSSIEFTGNKIFKSNKLRNIITSEENKFWKFISNKKFLNKEQLALDERLLKRFYLNSGYYDVKISGVFAKLLDSGNFNIVFNIDAGDVYTINKTNLVLPTDYDEDNFKDITELLKNIQNTKYSFLKINKIVDKIDQISLEKEYEFINATIDEKILDNNSLNIEILISETKKQYVERINIFGNNITQENVIRSALRINEGDAYNELLQIKSNNNLRGLNIFKSVTSTVREGSSAPQQIIDINVVEKPTGEISLGAGVGSDGGTLGFTVSENNYLGKGIKLRTSLRLSADTVRGQFSILNPNYKYSNKSIFTNIESSSTDKLANNGYKSNKIGFSVGTKFEQYEDFYFNPSINTYYETLETSKTATDALQKQKGNNFDTSFEYSLDYDKRDRKYMTTDGYRSIFSQTLPVISDVYSIANSYQVHNYHKFDNDMVSRVAFFGGAINSLANKDVRVSDRLNLPASSLKGFERNKFGPVDNGDYVGGNYAASINFSTTLPMLFESLDNADVSYFIDMGNVWGVDYSSALNDSGKLRSSTGVSVNWYTPIGPLNFSLAHAITKASTDRTEKFQFNLGTTF